MYSLGRYRALVLSDLGFNNGSTMVAGATGIVNGVNRQGFRPRPNEWHHLAFTYSGTTPQPVGYAGGYNSFLVSMYVDGE